MREGSWGTRERGLHKVCGQGACSASSASDSDWANAGGLTRWTQGIACLPMPPRAKRKPFNRSGPLITAAK